MALFPLRMGTGMTSPTRFCVYPSDTDSMIFQVLLRRSAAGQIEVSQRIVPVKISSNRVYNNYCPQPLEGKDKQRVLDKIAHLSEQL